MPKHTFSRQFFEVWWFYLKWYFRETRWAGVYISAREFFNAFSFFLYSFFATRVIDLLIMALRYGWETSLFLDKAKWYLGGYVFLVLIGWFFSFSEWIVDWLKEREALYSSFLRLLVDKILSLEHYQLEDHKIQSLLIKTWDMEYWPLRDLVFDTRAFIVTLLSLSFYLSFVSMSFNVAVYFLPVLFFVLLDAFVNFKETEKWHKNYDKTNESRKVLYEIYPFLGNLSFLWEAKLSKAFSFVKERYLEVLNMNKKKIYEGLGRLGAIAYSIRFLRTLSLILFYYGLLKMTLEGKLSVGSFAFYITTAPRFISLISQVFYTTSDMYNAYLRSLPFFKFYRIPTRSLDEGERLPSPQAIEIVAENVWFSYPGNQKWALRGVSFKIKPGEKVALVGENGAGKTTLLKLVLGFYKPQKGKILLNGIPSYLIRRRDIMRWFRILPQDFTRYHMFNVRENIALVEPERIKETEKVREAAQKSGAWEFIEKLQLGLETPLTRKLEGGTELSTGQWQKIALSRIFFKSGSVAILDEPTSAIDPISEREIFAHLAKELKDKTLIVVSHRYMTVQDMDRILVLKDGEIIEEGTHEELLGKQGYYYRAWRASRGEKKG